MVSEILNECFVIIKEYFGNDPPKIKSIIMGSKFVAVQLSDMSIGLSFIENEWPFHFPLLYKKKKNKESNQVYMLAKMAYVGNEMEISYGIATLNALTSSIFINSDRYNYIENIELLELWTKYLNPGTKVGMVGNMYPLVNILIEKGCDIMILDKHAMDYNKNCLPKEVKLVYNPTNLNDVEILIITGSSLIYHSTEDLINNSQNAFLKAIIGPTVTLPPEPFWKRGINFIGGAIVTIKFLQTMLTEGACENNSPNAQKTKKIALNFGKDTGLKKIGLINE